MALSVLFPHTVDDLALRTTFAHTIPLAELTVPVNKRDFIPTLSVVLEKAKLYTKEQE